MLALDVIFVCIEFTVFFQGWFFTTSSCTVVVKRDLDYREKKLYSTWVGIHDLGIKCR